VRQVLCYDPAGNPIARGAATDYPVRLAGECAAAYALLSSGYWTKTAFGTKPVPKDQVEVAVSSWLSFEGVKRIDRWGEGLTRQIGWGAAQAVESAALLVDDIVPEVPIRQWVVSFPHALRFLFATRPAVRQGRCWGSPTG
jgi:hypothetical protein